MKPEKKKPWTVARLIEALATMPPDAEVWISVPFDGCCRTTGDVTEALHEVVQGHETVRLSGNDED